ncbi:MAG: polyprenol monophosphomannose synthase [Actinobacteria bacterium]|nr:MAG: polyprenol monophosphomannose synthase [Actinomycetota bacterium]
MAGAITAHGYQLLIIDDGSPDGTGEIADRLASDDSLISVLHRTEKAGLGPAYAAGFRHAYEHLNAEVICEMDCDFSHDPADLPMLVEAVCAGADLAIGSRYVPGGSTPGWSILRRLISRGGNRYARTALGLDVRDATGGFRAFDAERLMDLDASSCGASGYAFQIEMVSRAVHRGFTIREVPIAFRDRMFGESKMSSRIVVEAMGLVTRWGWERVTGRLQPPSVPSTAQMSGRER